MTQISYLDISPRQTGKTTRLVKIAREHLERQQRVCFVTVEGMKEQIQTALPRALVLADGEAFPEGENPAASVWFYDEFDWLQSTELREGGYYATTPQFMRKLGEHTPENDLLMRLLQANGERFERHYWPFYMAELLRTARAGHSEDEFRRLYLGEFLE